MGNKFVVLLLGWFKIKGMREHDPYDQQVYKRLELVRRQFKRNTAELKIKQSATLRRELLDWLIWNKKSLVRWAVYLFLILLVLAVLGVTIMEVLKT
jgi:hypothetical protein